LEDGTVSFLSIISLQRGFDTLERLCGNMSRVQNHVFSLVQSAFTGLRALKHTATTTTTTNARESSAAGTAATDKAKNEEIRRIGSSSSRPARRSMRRSSSGDGGAVVEIYGIAGNRSPGASGGKNGDNRSMDEVNPIDFGRADDEQAEAGIRELNVEDHGSVLTFNVLRADGSYVGFAEVRCLHMNADDFLIFILYFSLFLKIGS
jgi:hypothetical protein